MSSQSLLSWTSPMRLPENYVPGPDAVIIGRGKLVLEHPGNIRFREMIDNTLDEYSKANTKGLKSDILQRVLLEVRNDSKDGIGFVKKDKKSGLWVLVEDPAARISIAQAFRDRLSKQYRSSKENKSIKRKVELGQHLTSEEEQKLWDAPIMPAVVNQKVDTTAVSAVKKQAGFVVNNQDVRSAKRVCLGPDTANKALACTFDMGSLGNLQQLRSILSSSKEIAFPSSYQNKYHHQQQQHQQLRSQDSTDTLSSICDRVWPVLSSDNLVIGSLERQRNTTSNVNATFDAVPVDRIGAEVTNGPASRMVDNIFDPLPLESGEIYGQEKLFFPNHKEMEQREALEKPSCFARNTPLADLFGESFENLFAPSS